MDEVTVRLLCPRCSKEWDAPPDRLPPSEEPFSCPSCGKRATTAEFMRTARDLEIFKQFSE